MNLQPLKNPLENRPTVLRVYRSLYDNVILSPADWGEMNSFISYTFKKFGGNPEILEKCSQNRIWGKAKSKTKVVIYPAEFIPVMKNIINDFVKRG